MIVIIKWASYICLDFYKCNSHKPGGLNLSWSCLDRDSQSRQEKTDLNTFNILVSTIENSRSRLRNLDFVLTPPSSLKSLDRDWEICRDMTFLANLDSLSWSPSRVSQFYHIYWSRFLNLSRFLILKSKSLDNVEISW